MTLDHAWQKTIGIHAAHVRYRDEFAKAYRTMGRLPLYSIQGAANHHKLNSDMFDVEKSTTAGGHPKRQVERKDADAAKAQAMQQDELFEIVREE